MLGDLNDYWEAQRMTETSANRLLGYPDDARLLIMNADDLGMCHSINVATFEAMRHGLVTTTSLMACCPWAWEAMHMLADSPELSFGVHLTLVNEMPGYRWGPIASKDTVPSLVNAAGFFLSHPEIPRLYAQARLEEVELEFRAQMERVLGFGLTPTHLDWHCVLDGGRPDILELSFELAREFGLTMRVSGDDVRDRCRALGLPANDYPIQDGYSLPVEGKMETYGRLLRELPPGLSQWAVHVSLGDAEAQAMEPDGWRVRKSDFDFLMSPEARAIIDETGIVLIDYQEIQKLWAARA